MGIGVLITGYVAIAGLTAVLTFQGAVLQRPSVKLFTVSEQLVLTGACLAVGTVWILFVPSLTYLAGRGIHRMLTRSAGDRWSPLPSTARARG